MYCLFTLSAAALSAALGSSGDAAAALGAPKPKDAPPSALAPKPKDRCVEDFKDDPLVQAAINNDPRIDRWEIGDLINRPAIGTKRPRSE